MNQNPTSAYAYPKALQSLLHLMNIRQRQKKNNQAAGHLTTSIPMDFAVLMIDRHKDLIGM